MHQFRFSRYKSSFWLICFCFQSDKLVSQVKDTEHTSGLAKLREMISLETLLQVNGLKKSFGSKQVLTGLTFDVKRGEILCFLGPNGAGKSTTINILTAALKKDGGNVLYKGRKITDNLRGYKQELGVVPQDIALYGELSARRNIEFFTSLYGFHGQKLDEAVEWGLDFSGLRDRSGDQVKTFSGGMKRRLNIACAVAHNPELVIMDEPTVGIDPQSRNHILDGIKRLRERGMTIIYTTHYMEEVEAISTRIIIMDKGKIIAKGTKEELKSGFEDERRYVIELADTSCVNANDFLHINGVTDAKADGNILEIKTSAKVQTLDKIIALLLNEMDKICNISSEEASLETVFLNLTGRKLRD